MWLTTTPRKHWLFDYFGPWENTKKVDPQAEFKKNGKVVDLFTLDNEKSGNLAPGFTASRRHSLTEQEARVLLEAAWEDINDTDSFLESMLWWDACKDPTLPALTSYEPMVLAADGAISNDYFALAGVTRHPTDKQRLALRYSKVWQPDAGQIDFEEVKSTILELKSRFDVVLLAYDPYQLHYLMTVLGEHLWCEPFSQQARRLEADKQLFDLIVSRRIAHDGTHEEMREHIKNADKKKLGEEDNRIRIIKRAESLKIDLAVSLSMACYDFLERLNI
jgi:phage terminase large subunit-like protein